VGLFQGKRIHEMVSAYRFAGQNKLPVEAPESARLLQSAARDLLRTPGNLLASTGRSSAARYKTIRGNDNWLLFPESLHSAISPADFYQDSIPAILDFEQQIESRGSSLLVVLLPAKWEIHPECLGQSFLPDPSSPAHPRRAKLLESLRSAGVEVIDGFEVLAEERQKNPDTLFFYREDTHWSPRAAQAVARRIAARIGTRLSKSTEPLVSFEEGVIEIIGDLNTFLHPDIPLAELPRHAYPARVSAGMPESSVDAEVLLLGDSYCFPELQTQLGNIPRACGLPVQLSIELGQPIQWITVAGGAAKGVRLELASRLVEKPDLLDNKKQVVWVLGPLSFLYGAESFPKVPLPTVPVGTSEIDPESLWKVIEVSSMEKLSSAPYPDAFLAVQFENASGDRVVGYLRVLKNRKLVAGLPPRSGSYVLLDSVAWNETPEELRQIHRLETFEDYDSPRLLVKKITLSHETFPPE